MKKILIPASILLLSSGLAFAQGDRENDDIVIFEGDTSNDLTISGDINEDITLYFGDTLSHFLRWDADKNIFVFSDNVDFGGHQLLNMRIENLSSAPTCDVNSSGRLYYNTGGNQSFVCNGSTWRQVDEEALSSTSPYLTSLSPSSLVAQESHQITITGGGFSPNTSVVIPGYQGSVGAVTVVSPSELQFNVTPSSDDSGKFDIIITSNGVTNSTWSGNGVQVLEIINTISLIPGIEDTIWERSSGVVTSQGKILPATDAQEWGKGASFGTVPVDSDFVLSFLPVYMAGKSSDGYAMIGVDNSDPNAEYSSIDFAFYIMGSELAIYENGVPRGSFGGFSIGDILSILREGTKIKYAVNGVEIYESSIRTSSSMVFDSSLYRWIGAENISLEY